MYLKSMNFDMKSSFLICGFSPQSCTIAFSLYMVKMSVYTGQNLNFIILTSEHDYIIINT